MAIYKNKDIEANINERGVELGNINVNFYTEDNGTASIRIKMRNQQGVPINFNNTDMQPRLDLYAKDGSIFTKEPVEIILPEQGLIQYKVSNYVIRHEGKIDCKLFLYNGNESVHVANFYFVIKDSGVTGAVGKEIKVDILQDMVRNVMVESAMGLLDDEYKDKINQDVVEYISSNPDKYKGPKGDKGEQGPKGDTGSNGIKGEKGDKGDKGDTLKYADLSTSEKEDLKSNITDQAVTDFVIEDKTINPEKTTFFDIEIGTNLLNLSTIKMKTSIDTDGVEIEDSTRWLTDFIPLDSSIQETINATQGSYRLALYDENKKFTDRAGFNGTKYTPHTATKTKYVRLSGTNELSTLMINKGSELLPYEKPGYGRIKLKPEYYDVPELEDNSVTSDKLLDNTITPEKTTFFDISRSNNLLDPSTVQKNKTLDTDGTIIEDSTRWLSDFIPLDELNEKFNFTQGTYRIGLYEEDKSFIIRTGVVNVTSYKPSTSPKTKYVRISGVINPSTVMVNKGDSLLPFEEYYGTQTKLKQEFLPPQTDDNNSPGTLLPSDLAKIEQNIQTYTPSIPKLDFEEVTTGYYEALWLSKDGKRVYGKQGTRLWVSYDECETFTTVIDNTGFSVQAIRELDDGELIFSTERDSTNRTQNGRVYKTKGFNKEIGEIDSYEMKVETPSTEAKINNSWGITSYKNVVTLSEYGLRTEEGARRAWLSTDYGETFKVIFDQKETTKLIEGAPEWTETAHMHTCSFDPYWNRIWIVTGDRPNSATYYSDDFGETWKWVDVQFNDDTMQFTGILALPNCVIFGSDRSPNGVFVYYRGNKPDTPVIQPLLLVNDNDKLSHVFHIPFKRDWNSLTPVYFSAPSAGDTDNKSLCVATVDGKKAFILHENNIDEKFGGKCLTFLGDTAQGNIIGTFFDSDISGYRIGKAKAPVWTKM